MALFKIFENSTTNNDLPSTYKKGYCYFDVRNKKFYIDTIDDDATGRYCLNANLADLANALTSKNIGGENIPVYFNSNGVPVPCTSTFAKIINQLMIESTDSQVLKINNNGTSTSTEIVFQQAGIDNVILSANNGDLKVTKPDYTGSYIILHENNYTTYITPAAIGAAPSLHTHSASDISSGTIAADRLPAATTSTQGAMTAAMVTKLNNIAEGANAYILPDATSSVLGGVRVGSNITVSSGTISLTKDNVTAALGYTPPTTDTTYNNMIAATESAAGEAGLVPAPAAGEQAAFLRGDGTWVVPASTTYSAGDGISLSENTFSNSGVRSIATGTADGTISVNTNGTTADVAVKGLGSNAYTSTAYLPLTGGTLTGNLTIGASYCSVNYDGYPQYALNNASGTSLGLIYMQTASGAYSNMYFRVFSNTSTYGEVYITSAGVLYGACWNDYAEYRAAEENAKPGQVVFEKGDDTLEISYKRLQKGCSIVSDTFGFAIGETDHAKTPLAVSGRVLAYTAEDRKSYEPGDAVCSGPNGTVSKMTREEIMMYPDCIIGYVSCVPTYETWGEKNTKVDGRIWIKVI